MDSIYESIYGDVYYIKDKNIVFVKWKSYCELNQYRQILNSALDIIKKNKCNYCADTRSGFVGNPLDTIWVKDYFMVKAKEYGCNIIYFIIDRNNSLKEELDGQENNSKDIIQFKYIYDIKEI